ncbi:MAG: AAA family ATPase [Muribaculaceae bacterium]|nr:AAA family ATPase [Muribaculaceae bacterium]
MKKIERFQITGMTISGFKCYQAPTILDFGPQTAITGGNGLGKTSIADAIAFAITGLPFFGERGIDKLHNEVQPEVSVSLRFLDEAGTHHELTRIRKKTA